MDNAEILTVEEKIGYTFCDKQLLMTAFVHSSYANQQKLADNDRLEFLGDAVLEFVVSQCLYERYPQKSAGDLSKMRATVVSQDGLRPAVFQMDLLPHLVVSKKSAVKTDSPKLAANLYEALLCAIYLDGGLEAAKAFVFRTLCDAIDHAEQSLNKDSKTKVQEHCQKNKWEFYYREESRLGPDNKPTFVCSLWVEGKKVATGIGSGKKKAEQDAASKIAKEWRID